MRQVSKLFFLFCLLVFAGFGCQSSEPKDEGKNVLDVTWGPGNRPWGSSGAYESDAKSEMWKDYYEKQIDFRDEKGNLRRPIEQISFLEEAPANREVDEPLPEEQKKAEFVASDGSRASLSDYEGQPVVLVFTRGFPGYICPFCTTYTAQLTARYDELQAQGAELLIVFPGDETKVEDFVTACQALLEEEGEEALPFPVFLDPELKVVDRFNIRGDLSLPSTFVLGPEGIVRYSYVGKLPHERPSVDVILKELKRLKAHGGENGEDE